MSKTKLRTELARGYRILGMQGIGLGILAHLTARLPGASTFWTYQFGQSVEEVKIEDLCEVDFDLKPVSGEGKVNPNLKIHGEIYAVRPDVLCIAHHHGENAIALGAIGKNLDPFDRNAGRWYNEIELVESYESPVLATQGASIASSLRKNKALLLKHHGALVTGSSIADVVVSTIELERVCGVQLKAMAAGELHLMPKGEIEDSRILASELFITGMWSYYLRSLQRHGSDIDL